MVYDYILYMSYGHPSHIENPYPYYLLNGCISPNKNGLMMTDEQFNNSLDGETTPCAFVPKDGMLAICRPAIFVITHASTKLTVEWAGTVGFSWE